MLNIVYFYLSLFLVTRVICAEGACDCSYTDSNFATDVNLIYYKCNDETPSTIAYPIAAPEGLLKVLEDKRTIFYIFGYLQFPEDANVKLMMKALCYNRTDNIVLLDWSKYSILSNEIKLLNLFYPLVLINSEKVGSLFARSIRLLVNSGLDVSKIYIVGHSLGAHIAGYAGKCNNFTIPRLTGLDPANPSFYPLGCYLTPTDAEWIDIIHTDMGGYGTLEATGTANYYSNSGTRPQPGCYFFGAPLTDTDFCSHQRSVKIYAESKRHPKKFIAVQCPSYGSYISNNCKNNLKTNVGYAASNVRGSFYFKTGTL